MNTLLEPEITAPSPIGSRNLQSQVVSLQEAERDSIQIYYASLTRRALGSWIVALLFLFMMGNSALAAASSRVAGMAVLALCVIGLAYAIYEYRRKQRVFILEDSFAVEKRFGFEVELIRWADVSKLYCLDRTTETKFSIYFIPVTTSKIHHGKLRMVLVDGRKIVITNRVRDYSAMARQFALRTTAAQLKPCLESLLSGGTVDFDKFSLMSTGIVYKRKVLDWGDIQNISLDRSGKLAFKTAKLWRTPRFSTDTLPNATLLLELLTMFWGDIAEA